MLAQRSTQQQFGASIFDADSFRENQALSLHAIDKEMHGVSVEYDEVMEILPFGYRVKFGWTDCRSDRSVAMQAGS